MPWSVGVGNRLDVKLTMLRASTLSFRGTWEWKTIASPVSVIYLCCALHDHFVKEYMDKTFDDEFHIDVNDPKIDGLFKPIKCHPPPWPDDGISESDNWVVEKSGPRPRKIPVKFAKVINRFAHSSQLITSSFEFTGKFNNTTWVLFHMLQIIL